jgi:hypothetical protein
VKEVLLMVNISPRRVDLIGAGVLGLEYAYRWALSP